MGIKKEFKIKNFNLHHEDSEIFAKPIVRSFFKNSFPSVTFMKESEGI